MVTLIWRGDEVSKKVEDALLDAAEEWLTAIVKTNSVARTPWQTGTLAGSHTVQRGAREVVLGVGGPAAPYATKIHEDSSLHHPHGESHFLEKAANETISELPAIIEKRMKSVL